MPGINGNVHFKQYYEMILSNILPLFYILSVWQGNLGRFPDECCKGFACTSVSEAASQAVYDLAIETMIFQYIDLNDFVKLQSQLKGSISHHLSHFMLHRSNFAEYPFALSDYSWVTMKTLKITPAWYNRFYDVYVFVNRVYWFMVQFWATKYTHTDLFWIPQCLYPVCYTFSVGSSTYLELFDGSVTRRRSTPREVCFVFMVLTWEFHAVGRPYHMTQLDTFNSANARILAFCFSRKLVISWNYLLVTEKLSFDKVLSDRWRPLWTWLL